MSHLVFTVPGRFPSLNEYTSANRNGYHTGDRMKHVNTQRVKACCMGLPPVAKGFPRTVRITWYEFNRRRDIDNITYAAKFILDGMKEAGIIPDDSQRYIDAIENRVKVDKANPRVVVEIL